MSIFSLIAAIALADPFAANATNRMTMAELDVATNIEQMVTVGGVVEDVFDDEAGGELSFVILRDDTGLGCLTLPKSQLDEDGMARLIRSEITATGRFSCRPLGRRRHFQRYVELERPEDIRIRRTEAVDPYAAPSLEELRNSDSTEIARSGRHQVSGYVIAVWSESGFTLDIPGSPPCMVYSNDDGQPPAVGDYVTAVGFPITDFFTIDMTAATWRKTAPPAPRPPEKVTEMSADDLFGDGDGEVRMMPEWCGRVFKVRGVVITLPNRLLPYGSASIESGRHRISIKAGSPDGNPFEDLELGDTVELTGVYTLRSQHWSRRTPFPHIKGFRLVVRDKKDVRVIAKSPWWTPLRLLGVIATLLTALVGILVWNRSLNRQVVRRTRQLVRERLACERARLKIGERNRLAIELHDSLSQNLSAIACQVSATRSAIAVGREEAEGALAKAERMLQSSRTELRRCLWDLREDALDAPDMTSALLKALPPVAGDCTLKIRFNVPRRQMDDTTTHAVICIVRELVSNAVRHGHATAVWVAGDLTNGLLAFSVRDNGIGFDPANRADGATGHFGLDGIRERCSRLGADFRLERLPEGGMRAAIAFRLAEGQEEETEA